MNYALNFFPSSVWMTWASSSRWSVLEWP